MAYTVPLGYDAAQHAHPQAHHHGQRPQHVRSSSAGMMGVQVESYGYAAAGPVRTDSPMQMQYTNAAAAAAAAAGAETYEMDIQQPGAAMVQDVDVQGLYVGMEAQYAAAAAAGAQQMGTTGYFPHPHHSL